MTDSPSVSLEKSCSRKRSNLYLHLTANGASRWPRGPMVWSTTRSLRTTMRAGSKVTMKNDSGFWSGVRSSSTRGSTARRRTPSLHGSAHGLVPNCWRLLLLGETPLAQRRWGMRTNEQCVVVASRHSQLPQHPTATPWASIEAISPLMCAIECPSFPDSQHGSRRIRRDISGRPAGTHPVRRLYSSPSSSRFWRRTNSLGMSPVR